MLTKTNELKPCPFCGCSNIHIVPDEVGSGGQWVGTIHVVCGGDCVAGQSGDDQDSAIAAWNRRATLQSQVKNDTPLFCDLKTDEEKCAFFLSGRGYETGVISQAIQNDVAMAYHRCAEYKKELEALQSQDREDAIPDEIRLMAKRIAADTFEHCTADPIFTVQKKWMVTGLDTNYSDNVGWFDTDSGDLVEGDEAAELEARYDDTGDEPEGYVRTGYFEEWEHYATFITMEAAQEFAKSKGENCRVYVDSGCRNHEWKALRAFLLSIGHARRIEGGGNKG